MKKLLLLVVAMAISFTFMATQLKPPEEIFLHDIANQEIDDHVMLESFDVAYLENENVSFSYDIARLDQQERLWYIENNADLKTDRHANTMAMLSISDKAQTEYG